MLKQIIKKIIIAALTLEAKLILRKYDPKIIAVTGNVGKTSTKEAIAAVLGSRFFVRKSLKSYNSEFGVPLTIIGSETGWNRIFAWVKILGDGFVLIFKKRDYPHFLVLEIGADRPGDIQKISKWVKPHATVVTSIGEVPVHVEFFAGPEMLAREKSKLVQNTRIGGHVLLNYDDDTVLAMKNKARANVITYGFGEGADVRGSNYSISYERGENGLERPEGFSFKADYKGNSVPVRIHESFGKKQMYSALAALAVGVSQELSILDLSSALSLYKSPPGRLKLIEGIKKAWILDDTYNSSPAALHAALDLLKDFPASPRQNGETGRKIAVIGDMLELGKFTIDAHKAVGQRIGSVAQILCTVGPRARFIAEEARETGFSKNRIFEFSDSVEAGRMLETEIAEGDIILVKGSQAMRMEKIVETIMRHPEKKEELLVRQEKEWQ